MTVKRKRFAVDVEYKHDEFTTVEVFAPCREAAVKMALAMVSSWAGVSCVVVLEAGEVDG